MTAGGRARPGRFVLAPVVGGAAAWDRGTHLVIAPVRLTEPVVLLRTRAVTR